MPGSIDSTPDDSKLADGERSLSAQGMDEAAEHSQLFVEEVVVRDFRGIRYCRIQLDPKLTLLVGPNNIGKSRLLRAIGIALGHIPADRDDRTLNSGEDPTIDVVLAPPRSESTDEELFRDRERQLLQDVQLIGENPDRERFAWRTKILPSSEGLGVRAEQTILHFDARSEEWTEPPYGSALERGQRRLIACDLVDANRDLVADISRRSSPIRRIMDDLEVPEELRAEIEDRLSQLGADIIENSAALSSVRRELELLGQYVETVGSAVVEPLPPRLEEVGRSVSIGFNTGSGTVPIRFHGSGTRSLAALQTQGVMYARRLGRDGGTLLPHPVSLIEEPEAHLHPQAQFDLAELLVALKGQTIASTHSSHLVTVADPNAIRVLHRTGSELTAKHLLGGGDAPLGQREVEKLRRMIERPFGELLFSSAIVIVEGATERAFFSPLIRHALGPGGHGVCVVDSGGIEKDYATAILKFARRMGIPWLLIADTDEHGRRAIARVERRAEDGATERLIRISPETDQCIEDVLLEFDEVLCGEACKALGFEQGSELREFMEQHKGSYGREVAMALLEQRPWPPDQEKPAAPWPAVAIEVVTKLRSLLTLGT